MNSESDQTVIISPTEKVAGSNTGEKLAPQFTPDDHRPRIGLTGMGWLLVVGGLALTYFGPARLEKLLTGSPLDRWLIDILFWNKDKGGWPARAFCGLTACFLFLGVTPLFRVFGHPLFQDRD
jgi:hypothetical protein